MCTDGDGENRSASNRADRRIMRALALAIAALTVTISVSLADELERDKLLAELPITSGSWQVTEDRDPLTDAVRVVAKSKVDGDQASYEVRMICAESGLRLRLTSFDLSSTAPLDFPWNYPEQEHTIKIRLRIDAGPVLEAVLLEHGYANEGDVAGTGESLKLGYNDFTRSKQIVVADMFPDERLVIPTSLPIPIPAALSGSLQG